MEDLNEGRSIKKWKILRRKRVNCLSCFVCECPTHRTDGHARTQHKAQEEERSSPQGPRWPVRLPKQRKAAQWVLLLFHLTLLWVYTAGTHPSVTIIIKATNIYWVFPLFLGIGHKYFLKLILEHAGLNCTGLLICRYVFNKYLKCYFCSL